MKKLIAMPILLAAALNTLASTSPFQLSLTPDIAIKPRDTIIEGVALSIWGENEQTALALGFVNGSKGNSAGFSYGLFNYAENYKGVHWGIANCASGEFIGWQHGVVNYAGSIKGLQTGAVNIANALYGVQWGYVNYAKTVNTWGLQIGLVNIIPENQEWFTGLPQEVAPGMIFVNWRFE